MKLLENRRKIQTTSTNRENEIKTVNKEMKRSCKREQNAYLSTIREEVQKHADNNESRDLYKKG